MKLFEQGIWKNKEVIFGGRKFNGAQTLSTFDGSDYGWQ